MQIRRAGTLSEDFGKALEKLAGLPGAPAAAPAVAPAPSAGPMTPAAPAVVPGRTPNPYRGQPDQRLYNDAVYKKYGPQGTKITPQQGQEILAQWQQLGLDQNDAPVVQDATGQWMID